MKFSCICSTSDVAEDIAPSTNTQKGDQEFRLFSYNELKAATAAFKSSNKIGQGGYGSVYKGHLKDGGVVAIKVLSIERESMRGEREFISELTALSDARHENLVRLLGCCVEGASRYLIYDYMENNSITHTFLGRDIDRSSFSWTRRREISLGIARGLVYLHEEITPHIVHRDIKARNILLDRNFVPKVADFGLARLFRDDSTHISTRVAGTLGYLSPEYAISGRLTRKSDIYSYGVLLLEIVSGRSVVAFDMERGEQFLVDKAWEMYNADELVQLVDPELKGDFLEEEAVRFMKVGLLCVQETSKLRPRMSSVIKMLNNEIKIEHSKISQPGSEATILDEIVGEILLKVNSKALAVCKYLIRLDSRVEEITPLGVDCSVRIDDRLEAMAAATISLRKGNTRLPPEVNRALFVRNLPFNITSEEMYDIFGKYGAIRQIRLGNSKETRGTAYVVYEDIYDAKTAVDHLSGFNVANRYLIVLYYQQAKMSKKFDHKKKEDEITRLQEKYGVSTKD
ncbi:hypothetical protein ACET3Z_009459 [Daucus carota]